MDYPAPETHRHTIMVIQVGDRATYGWWRWMCSSCGTVGGPPYPTKAEAWGVKAYLDRGYQRKALRTESLSSVGLV